MAINLLLAPCAAGDVASHNSFLMERISESITFFARPAELKHGGLEATRLLAYNGKHLELAAGHGSSTQQAAFLGRQGS